MKLVLIGGGGHALVVADVARSAGFELRGALTADDASARSGLTRLGDDGWIDEAPSGTAFHVAFGPGHGRGDRAALFERLVQRGVALPSIVASTATISPSATVGEGAVVMHGAVVNAEGRIGRNAIVNTRAVVEHDCVVGDHAHIAPGALLSGGARVGSGCIIGTGAIVLPGITIAEGVTIGAGAVVVRPIEEPNGIWSGNPARRHA